MGSWRNATRLSPELRRPPTSTVAGVLHPDEGRRYFTVERPPADPRLDLWVEHYWTVRWKLPEGTTYQSEVLTHPVLHLTIESGAGPRHGYPMPAALLHGVVTRRFTVMLRGEGSVFGVKFRPGGFGAFTGVDVGALADRVEPLSTVFGSDAEDLLDQMLRPNADAERVALLNRFLLQRLPGPDARYARLLEVVRTMLTDRSITSVEQVTERFGISPRTLQRLFRRYVGVGPKWVLQRFRLHDAAALLDAGGTPDLATLAHSLGWFDQAHFSRDFAAAVGETPRAYAARAAAAR